METNDAYDKTGRGEIRTNPGKDSPIDPIGGNQGDSLRPDMADPGRGPGQGQMEPGEGQEDRRFYVYFLRRPDKEDPIEPWNDCPFYVGKGSNDRIKVHRKEANDLRHKPGRKTVKIRLIHKLWKHGLDFTEEIILDNLTEQESFETEKEIIKIYGRIDLETGCLTNMTDGGEGGVGWVATDEYRKKLSKALKGRIFSKEHIEKIRKANRGHFPSKETRKKLSIAGKGKTHSSKTRKILSDKLKGHPTSEETKRKISIANSGKEISQETRDKISKANKGKVSGGPGKGINHFFYGKHHTKETKEKIRNSLKGRKVIFTEDHKNNLALAFQNLTDEQKQQRLQKLSNAKKQYWKHWRWDKIIHQYLGEMT